MLFMFKKNEMLQSYVNYQELNIIIFKNKYSFLLINESLNHFKDVMFFIKFDIKNTFNKLCI